MNWQRINAGGRHAVTFISGIVTALVTFHLLSSADGATIGQAISSISDGIGKIGQGLLAIAGIVGPIYAGWRAQKLASPAEQVKSVITNLSAPQITQEANKIADPTSRNKLIDAVAEMPEVKSIKADPAVAMATESTKVVK